MNGLLLYGCTPSSCLMAGYSPIHTPLSATAHAIRGHFPLKRGNKKEGILFGRNAAMYGRWYVLNFELLTLN